MRNKLVIICVLLITAFVGGVAGFFLKARKDPATPKPDVPVPVTQTQSVATTSTTNASFADLRETDIPGRYMMYGNEEYPLTLYADHTFLNKDGKIYSQHRWYLTPEALVIDWGPNQHRYDRIEGPGIYSCPKSIGGRRRLEKQPADPSDLIKPMRRR
jgi:hypothetical protein